MIIDLLNSIQTDPQLQWLLSGILLSGLSCSLLSTFVVVRHLTLPGIGIGGATIAGIMAGLMLFPAQPFFSWETAALATSCSAVVAGITYAFTRKTHNGEDIRLGFFVVIALVSIMLLNEMEIPYPKVDTYLFQTAHIQSLTDLDILAGATCLILLLVWLIHKPLIVICIDEDYAHVMGIRTRLVEMILLGMITLIILLSAYYINVLFALAMLIFPAVGARSITFHVPRMILLSIVLGMVTCTISLLLHQLYPIFPATLLLVFIQLGAVTILSACSKIGLFRSY